MYDFSEIHYCCSNCKKIVDIHTSSRSKGVQCLQPWNESFAINVSRTLFHLEVCNYLGITSNMKLEDEFKYKNQGSNSESSLDNSSKKVKKIYEIKINLCHR